MLRDIPITEARHVLTSLPEELSGSHEVVTVTRRGKPVLAILPWEEYETLVETLDIMADEELMAVFRQGVKEVKEGRDIPWSNAKRQIGL